MREGVDFMTPGDKLWVINYGGKMVSKQMGYFGWVTLVRYIAN